MFGFVSANVIDSAIPKIDCHVEVQCTEGVVALRSINRVRNTCGKVTDTKEGKLA